MQTQAEGFNLELPDSQNFAPAQNHAQGTSHFFGTHDNEGLDDDFLQALGDFANEHQAQGTQQAETPHTLQQHQQPQQSQQQLQTQQPPPTPTHAQQSPEQHQQPSSQATSHPLTEPNTAMQLNFDFEQSFDFDVSSSSEIPPV